MPWPVSIAMGSAGMRGVVTLAAAFSLPRAMPERGLIMLCAYAVVFGTPVLQGATLGPLSRRLGIGDDGVTEHEIAELRRELVRRVLAAVEGCEDDAPSMRIRLLQMRQ